jgi:hypothetical protein
MNQDNLKISFFLRTVAYFIRLHASLFLTFVIADLFMIIILNLQGTAMEKTFFYIFSNTPFMGLKGESSFSVGIKEVLFFSISGP